MSHRSTRLAGKNQIEYNLFIAQGGVFLMMKFGDRPEHYQESLSIMTEARVTPSSSMHKIVLADLTLVH
jgi:hypothetical protein